VALFEEITQTLEAPELDLGDVERQPRYVGQYQLGNVLQRSIANLAVVQNSRSLLVRGNTAGAVATFLTDAVYGYGVRSSAQGELKTQVGWADVQARCGFPGDADSGHNHLYVTGYHLKELHTILSDCWDGINHALKVVVVTP
jgi:hypothetical protein